MTEEQQVREAIREILKSTPKILPPEVAIARILSLKYPNGQLMIGILAENQEKPPKPTNWKNENMNYMAGYYEAEEIYQEEGWRRTYEQ